MNVYNPQADYDAIGYLRVSTPKQVKMGEGLKTQKNVIESDFKSLKIKNAYIFEDDGISGKDASSRDGFQLAIKAAIKHKVRYFFCYDTSRFARNTVESITLRATLYAHGIKLYLPKNGGESDYSPTGNFVHTILAAKDQLEREQTAEKVKDRFRISRAEGKHLGPALGGYKNITLENGRKDVVLDEVHGETMREALKGIVSGRFLNATEVTQFLNSRNFRHNKMKDNQDSVTVKYTSRALRNRFYAGEQWDKDQNKFIKHKYETLISLSEHLTIVEILDKKPKKKTYKKINKEFPLKQFCVCSKCGKTMKAYITKGGNAKVYDCRTKGCGNATVTSKVHPVFEKELKSLEFEKPVINLFKEVLIRKFKANNHIIAEQKKLLSFQIKSIEKEIESIYENYKASSGSIRLRLEKDYHDMEDKLKVLNEKIIEIESRFENCEPVVNHAAQYLDNPLLTWKRVDIRTKIKYQKWIYPQGIQFHKISGLRTLDKCITYNALEDIKTKKSHKLTPRRIELRLPD